MAREGRIVALPVTPFKSSGFYARDLANRGLSMMIQLSPRGAWLSWKPETGMGYQIVTIVLKDGRRFEQVVIVEGLIGKIRGRRDIPFTEDDIAEITITHDKWDWKEDEE